MKHLAIYSLVLMAIFFIFVFNALAQAPMEPQTVLDVLGLMPELQRAIDAENWALAACIGLMTITWGIKRFALPRDGSKDVILPIISASLGAIFGGGASLMSGQGDPATSALGGMMMGNAASGAYDTFFKSGKKILKKELSKDQ